MGDMTAEVDDTEAGDEAAGIGGHYLHIPIADYPPGDLIRYALWCESEGVEPFHPRDEGEGEGGQVKVWSVGQGELVEVPAEWEKLHP